MWAKELDFFGFGKIKIAFLAIIVFTIIEFTSVV